MNSFFKASGDYYKYQIHENVSNATNVYKVAERKEGGEKAREPLTSANWS